MFPNLRVVTAAAIVLLSARAVPAAQTPNGPKPGAAAKSTPLSKADLANYIRYAEGFVSQVEVTVDDPKPSPFPGFSEITVHLKAGRNQAMRTYYLTEDGQRLVSGTLYDLRKSPFAVNLPRLKEEGAPTMGPEQAPVRIFVFSDFQCPYCREEAKVLRTGIDKKYANDVRIVFKDFPLDAIHPWARTAAKTGQCIANQKPAAFWAFHDWIYEHQREINVDNFKTKAAEFAKSQALDESKLASCTDSQSIADRVEKNVAEARELGVEETPTLFVNGRKIGGALSPEKLNLLIELELSHHLKQTASDKPGCCEVVIPKVAKN